MDLINRKISESLEAPPPPLEGLKPIATRISESDPNVRSVQQENCVLSLPHLLLPFKHRAYSCALVSHLSSGIYTSNPVAQSKILYNY